MAAQRASKLDWEASASAAGGAGSQRADQRRLCRLSAGDHFLHTGSVPVVCGCLWVFVGAHVCVCVCV